ncbi:MAG: ABC transporter permease [Acidobacteriota bacterium]|nr:ABC transporter permease [Acidobacteriota bacterium]
MRFELKLTLSYFRARRKSLARFTSLVAVVGITAGVASLIIANALARGFSDEMRDKILANTAHITIFTTDGAEILSWHEIKENLEKLENVKEVSATTYESALITGKDSTGYAILRVVQSPKSKVQSHEQPETWNLKLVTIKVGAKLAEKTGLKAGDDAEIITLANQTEAKRSRIVVKETFQTGLYEYDSSWIYISPEDFARLSGKQVFTPTILSIFVKDIYNSDKTAAQVRVTLGKKFKVVDWQEANQPLFAALSLERKVALVIISLIIFIAALNITTTLALLVNERRLDIAILRTCGTKTQSLIFIFLVEGLFLGFIGIFFGVVLGLLVCVSGNYFKIIRISAEIYSLEFIPFRPHLATILLIVVITIIVCLTATIYPALKASRVKPSENLRTQ